MNQEDRNNIPETIWVKAQGKHQRNFAGFFGFVTQALALEKVFSCWGKTIL